MLPNHLQKLQQFKTRGNYFQFFLVGFLDPFWSILHLPFRKDPRWNHRCKKTMKNQGAQEAWIPAWHSLRDQNRQLRFLIFNGPSLLRTVDCWCLLGCLHTRNNKQQKTKMENGWRLVMSHVERAFYENLQWFHWRFGNVIAVVIEGNWDAESWGGEFPQYNLNVKHTSARQNGR